MKLSFEIKKCKLNRRPAMRCFVTDDQGNKATNIIYTDTDCYECNETTVKVYAIYNLFEKLKKPITREEAHNLATA